MYLLQRGVPLEKGLPGTQKEKKKTKTFAKKFYKGKMSLMTNEEAQGHL